MKIAYRLLISTYSKGIFELQPRGGGGETNETNFSSIQT
jgi:hypothetical protein